jgi:hypothetical protein
MGVQTALVKVFGHDLFTWITPWVSSLSSIQFMFAMGSDQAFWEEYWHAPMGLLMWKAVV